VYFCRFVADDTAVNFCYLNIRLLHYVQLYSRGHVKLLGTELCDLDVFAHLLKVNDKRFVCSLSYTFV